MEQYLEYSPIVFAVEEEYQITLRVASPCVCAVEVGKERYYDDANGVLRTDCAVHRVTVPMAVLDEAKAYTVILSGCPERRSYYTKLEPEERTVFSFCPLPKEGARLFFLSDTHGWYEPVVRAAKAGGEYDAILFGGDIANDSGSDEARELMFRLSDILTHGTLPVLAVRGNHDTRGVLAETISTYYPLAEGRTYYPVTLGSLRILVLDCGEDKLDSCSEYGGVNCFEQFRRTETRWLRAFAERESAEGGAARYRMAVCHMPFTHRHDEPGEEIFNIENELYDEWTMLLDRSIRPQLLLSGHEHVHSVQAGDRGAENFLTVVGAARGSEAYPDRDYFSGTRLILENGKIRADFCDSEGSVTPVGTA